MSSGVSTLSLALFTIVLFISDCDGRQKEASLRQAFIEHAKENNIQLALSSFERLSTQYSVTAAEVIEAVSLMLFCEGEVERAAQHLGSLEPREILRNESYSHLEHDDAEAVQRLNYHYYRSYYYLLSFLTCATESYEQCQSITKNALDEISENTQVDLNSSSGVQYFEINELREMQSMSADSVRSKVQQNLKEYIRQCESVRVD
jgi:hypothetical protein